MTADNGRSIGGVSRRKFIATTGTAGVLSVAGCSENEASGSGNGNGENGNGGNGNGNGNGDSDSGNGGNGNGDGNGGNGNGDDGNGDDDGNSDGEDLSGEIVTAGSSTVFPVTDAMAEEFMGMHPDVNVTTDSTGSGGGFENHFCPGDSDLNGASRPIKEEETSQCEENDVNPIEFEVAGDALTMAVSPDNDWVDCMTFDELAQIWEEDGAETWADVNEDWPDEEFVLYGPDDTSGTFDWFTENVVGEAGNHRTDYEPTEDDNIIVEGLESDPNAMGYFGYAYYQENEDRVKALSIAESEDDECGEPGLQEASEGTYPMARPLFVYVSEESLQRPEMEEFMRFYLEECGEDWIADDVGYVPSNDDQVEENLSTLEDHL